MYALFERPRHLYCCSRMAWTAHFRPGYYVPDLCIGRNKTAIHMVSLISGKCLVNRLRNGTLLEVMILPYISFRVADGNLPIEFRRRTVVFNIDHLSGARGAHSRTSCCQHINAMMKVSVNQVAGIKLI